MKRSAYAVAAFGLLVTTMLPAAGEAGAFAAWQVRNVPFGDVLNVRKYPASNSQKQAAYPNGTVLQMTGTCTGGIDLLDIAGLPESGQAQMVRFSWCQVWHDPAKDGNFVTGWVYGRYIAPW